MGMTWEHWAAITARLNLSYPDQPINEGTAREWFAELEPLDAGDVWLAIRTIRREERFRPTLASILAGVELHRRDMAAARQAQLALAARPDHHRGGVPMPPETREALAILGEAAKPDGDVDRQQAAAMIAALADQIEQRAQGRAESAADATRICPKCASSPVEGAVQYLLPAGHPDNLGDHPLQVYVPCSSCRPGRHHTWKAGQLHLRTDDRGYPLRSNAAR